MSCEEIITDGDWERLKEHDEYEICKVYPHLIRRAKDKYILKETLDRNYLRVSLNQKLYFKHKLIALQWITNPNPTEYVCVDHVNRNSLDNRIENLFWCSNYENMNNKSATNGNKTEYIDALPDDAIIVDHYNEFRFEGYYFSLEEDKFYRALRNGNIRVIPTYEHHDMRVVKLSDTDKHRHEINYNKFLRIYDLE